MTRVNNFDSRFLWRDFLEIGFFLTAVTFDILVAFSCNKHGFVNEHLIFNLVVRLQSCIKYNAHNTAVNLACLALLHAKNARHAKFTAVSRTSARQKCRPREFSHLTCSSFTVALSDYFAYKDTKPV